MNFPNVKQIDNWFARNHFQVLVLEFALISFSIILSFFSQHMIIIFLKYGTFALLLSIISIKIFVRWRERERVIAFPYLGITIDRQFTDAIRKARKDRSLEWSKIGPEHDASATSFDDAILLEQRIFRGTAYPTWSKRWISSDHQKLFYSKLTQHNGFSLVVARTRSEHPTLVAHEGAIGFYWLAGVSDQFYHNYVNGKCRAYDLNANDIRPIEEAPAIMVGGSGFLGNDPCLVINFIVEIESRTRAAKPETILFSACPDIHRRRAMELLGADQKGQTAAGRPVLATTLFSFRKRLLSEGLGDTNLT